MKKINISSFLPWLIWIIPFFLFYFVHSNKIYILVYVVFIAAIFFVLKKNIYETLFLTLLLSLPFEKVIRSWQQIVVPDIGNKVIPGYKIYFGISPKTIIAFSLFALVAIRIIKFHKYKIKNNQYILYLIFFLITATISSAFAFRIDLAFNGIFRLWTSIWIFISCQIFFAKSNLRQHLKRFLICISVFMGAIGTMQFIKHGLLGLYLESYSNIDSLGFFTTDGYEIYRVSGVMTHPTYFGSFISMLFPICLGTLIQDLIKNKKLTITNSISGLAIILITISIIATFSRSAWIASIVSLFLILFKTKRNFDWQTIFKSKLFSLFLICLLGIIIINSNNIIERAVSVKNVWTQGTGSGRIEHIRQAFAMMQNHPLIGVGFNNFTKAMLDQGLDNKYREFFYPIHNTFLLFFSELGIPAGMIFLIFAIQLMTRNYNKSQHNLFDYSLWIATLCFIINSQFHTLFSQDPSFDLFMALAAFLSIV